MVSCVKQHIFVLHICIPASVSLLSGKLLAHLFGMSLNTRHGKLEFTLLHFSSLLHWSCQVNLTVMSSHYLSITALRASGTNYGGILAFYVCLFIIIS